ncbi:MAG: hypothetical protein IPK65_05885 [Gammaproteobacteria bacterium]|nr:hypothetical protein [Gammaproteobacteria bacterium]
MSGGMSVPARLALLALAVALASCGMSKPDLRYRDSRLEPPLSLPAGVDSPGYSASMEIPRAGSAAPGAEGLDIEFPPDLRAVDPVLVTE